MAGDRIEVTDQNFAELLLRGAEEMAAVERGELEPARVRRYITAREGQVRPPKQYRGQHISRIRARLGVSQAIFAALLGVAPRTVRAWEQGQNEPSGPARRLLEVAEEHPEVLTPALAASGAGSDGR